MCVYYGSSNKTINAKNSLHHSRYLGNAGNSTIVDYFFLEYTTFVLFLFVFLFNMVHTIMRTSTLRVKEG